MSFKIFKLKTQIINKVNSGQTNINPFEYFTGREGSIIIEKHCFSSTIIMGWTNYMKGKIIKEYPRFI